MELVRGWHNLTQAHRGCVLTIGNYDGVHLGHRAVIRQVQRAGERLRLPTALMTFEPHPREFFSASHAPPRLTRLREKLVALADTRIDRVVVLRFDEALASTAPADFVDRLLLDGLGAAHIVVGDDFRFGRRAEGNYELLREMAAGRGFAVERCDSYVVGGARVSSSRVRDRLAHGELGEAAALLGRPYSICGRVTGGDARGRTIGYPTANVLLHRVATPLTGVYAVRVHGLGAGALPGMANIGTRPTVGGARMLLEVHLFDFSDDLYGRLLEVEFVHRLRDERRFDGLDALVAQLGRDEAAAREVLARPPPAPAGRAAS